MNTDQKIIENIKKNKLFENCNGVVLAVSGGSDSMAMLAFFIKNKHLFDFPFVVAHVNHNIREESADEEEFVANYCCEKDVSYEILSVDILKDKPSDKTVEEYSRNVRYGFFNKVRSNRGFSHIATAHNKNDATETFFLNIIRGSGQKGASGLTIFREDFVVRPIICCEKCEVENYCNDNKIPFMTDYSNFSNIYTRNTLRNKILPLIRQLNPSLDTAIEKITEMASEDEKYLTEISEKKLSELDDLYGKKRLINELPLTFLSNLEKPILSRVIRLFYERITKGKHLTFKQTSDIILLIQNGKTSDNVQLSENYRVYISYQSLIFTSKAITESEPLETTPLNLGKNIIGDIEVEIKKTFVKKENVLNCVNAKPPFYIRSRKQGDTIALFLRPTKKISDIFIDEKIPLIYRNSYFVIVNQDDKVIMLRNFGADKNALPEIGKLGYEIRFIQKETIEEGGF